MHLYLGEDQEAYVRKFHEKALLYCDPVAKVVLIDVFLHDMIEDIKFPRELVFSFFFFFFPA